MGKWLLGIFTAVVTALAIAYFKLYLPSPAPQANAVVGYLVANPNSGISDISDVRSSHTICGTAGSMGTARATPSISHAQLRVLPGSELYPAFQTGICNTVFFADQSEADQLFPLKITNFRVIPVMGFAK